MVWQVGAVAKSRREHPQVRPAARTWACSLLHSAKYCPDKRQCNSRRAWQRMHFGGNPIVGACRGPLRTLRVRCRVRGPERRLPSGQVRPHECGALHRRHTLRGTPTCHCEPRRGVAVSPGHACRPFHRPFGLLAVAAQPNPLLPPKSIQYPRLGLPVCFCGSEPDKSASRSCQSGVACSVARRGSALRRAGSLQPSRAARHKWSRALSLSPTLARATAAS